MGAPYSAKAVANEFLSRAREEAKALTQLELQKLVYFAHGWHLAVVGRPLVSEPIEAWKFGPVVGSLYKEFADYRALPIERYATTDWGDIPHVPEDDQPARAIIDLVWNGYGTWTPGQLVADTHRPDGPWHLIYGKGKEHRPIIPDELIQDHFVARGIEAESAPA